MSKTFKSAPVKFDDFLFDRLRGNGEFTELLFDPHTSEHVPYEEADEAHLETGDYYEYSHIIGCMISVENLEEPNANNVFIVTTKEIFEPFGSTADFNWSVLEQKWFLISYEDFKEIGSIEGIPSYITEALEKDDPYKKFVENNDEAIKYTGQTLMRPKTPKEAARIVRRLEKENKNVFLLTGEGSVIQYEANVNHTKWSISSYIRETEYVIDVILKEGVFV